MNKLLFGIIGLLFAGVIGMGTIALRPATDTGIALYEPPALETESSTPEEVVPSSPTSGVPAPQPKPPSLTPQPAPHPFPVPTPAPAPQPDGYTMAEVAAHNSEASCYTVIAGSVYDVTPFIRKHPGGSRAILSLCGRDGTAAFEGQHGGQGRPASELANYRIGKLVT